METTVTNRHGLGKETTIVNRCLRAAAGAAFSLAMGVGLATQAQAADGPTLGVAHPAGAPDASGLGTVRPTLFSIASTGSSTTRDVVWDSWGGPQATGHGVTADGASHPNVPLNLVAFDLGTCDGHPAYRKLHRFAPGEQGVVDDIC